jgi:hypothetical protein
MEISICTAPLRFTLHISSSQVQLGRVICCADSDCQNEPQPNLRSVDVVNGTDSRTDKQRRINRGQKGATRKSRAGEFIVLSPKMIARVKCKIRRQQPFIRKKRWTTSRLVSQSIAIRNPSLPSVPFPNPQCFKSMTKWRLHHQHHASHLPQFLPLLSCMYPPSYIYGIASYEPLPVCAARSENSQYTIRPTTGKMKTPTHQSSLWEGGRFDLRTSTAYSLAPLQ